MNWPSSTTPCAFINRRAEVFISTHRRKVCNLGVIGKLHRVSQPATALQPGCEEMEKEWGNEEEMEREWGNGERLTLYISSFSLHILPLSPHFLILSPFPPSLSISYIKICHILSQNVKYGTFVANVTKVLTYALWGNDSGSNQVARKPRKLFWPVNHIFIVLDDDGDRMCASLAMPWIF